MAYSHPCPHFSSSAGNAQFVCISHRKAADFSPFRPTLALMHAFMLCKRGIERNRQRRTTAMVATIHAALQPNQSI
eukprot:6179278-Pleurochrysis_carterae.AAC.1